MTKIELNKHLLEMIPEIKDNFDNICNELDGIETGSTIVMEDVFMPFFLSAIKSNEHDLILKSQLFIEWLSDYYSDQYAGDVLVISIYENIHSLKNEKEVLDKLGVKAKKQYNAIDWQ